MSPLTLLEAAGQSAAEQSNPEAALRQLLSPLQETLGERGPDIVPPDGAAQFFVAGAFMVSPDTSWHMLVANIGFPPEQSRLMIPLAGGHPGRVHASRAPLHLPDTEADGQFRQYLRTARMGSAVYVPMLWESRFLGQIVLAAKARHSLSETDFLTMRAAAPLAAAMWVAKGGDAWLHATYPPSEGFRVPVDGM